MITNRKLFQEIMHYGTFDRMPLIHWKGWPETVERWEGEGLPEGADQHKYFNTSPQWVGVSADNYLLPLFEEKIIEETEEYRLLRDVNGVITKAWKNKSCIPQYSGFTFKTAADWPEFKKRLQPSQERIPENFDEIVKDALESGLPVLVGTGSMMGWIRNWMGVENMCYMMYDDPDVYADIVNTMADLTCWCLDAVLPRAICGKSGPLVSPDVFERCVAQGYRKIRNKLDSHGIHLFGLDSDGFVEPLLQNWMDAGINVMFPIEPGTWEATPEDIRKKFGKELRIIGGFDKLVLEKDKAAIDAEFAKHVDLMKEGGFIMMPDHLITPGTPLDNYKYYLEKVREFRF